MEDLHGEVSILNGLTIINKPKIIILNILTKNPLIIRGFFVLLSLQSVYFIFENTFVVVPFLLNISI